MVFRVPSVIVSWSLSSFLAKLTPIALATQHLQEDQDYWPPYGCTIAFAVSHWREEAVAQEPRKGQEERGHGNGIVLEISVDDEPLRSSLFRSHEGKPGAVSLSEFGTALKRLLPP